MKRIFSISLILDYHCSIFFIAGLLTTFCFTVSLSAQTAGSLDPTFNGTGFVTTSFGGNSQNPAVASVIQPDGKIIAAGYNKQSFSAQNQIALVRYKPDGTLDQLFHGGKVTTAVGVNSSAAAIALQSDGKILVAGAAEILNGNTDFIVVRYDGNGFLDNSFGNNGVVTTAVGILTDEATSIIIQPDGKIIVGGSSLSAQNYDYSAVRYNSDGSLDTSFGNGGKLLIPVGDDDDFAAAAVLQPNGKFVMTGAAKSGTRYNIATIRFNIDGSLDTTFGQNGKTITPVGLNAEATDIVRQPDGKLVVSGAAVITASLDSIVIRYNSDGRLDSLFGSNGVTITSVSTIAVDYAFSLALQMNGKVVVSGMSCVQTSCDFYVTRYNQNGALDTTFGTGGIVTTPLGNTDFIKNSVEIQSDGKIVLVGTDLNGSTNGDPLDFAVVRYLPGERAKFDFDGDGKSDISVFRPSNGAWYVLQSSSGFTSITFGIGTDKIVPADYDGDGKTDVAVFRNGIWYLQRSQSGFASATFGTPNDVPVPADYDGDGKADLGVFRPSTGYWYLLNSSNNQTTAVLFGQNGDKPVPADYDGDGKADIAVNRAGVWYLNRSATGFAGITFGNAGDKLVPADYDGDGKTDIAVFRPSNGTWYLLQSQNGFTGISFGLEFDMPAAADYDGDGKADLTVVRDGLWYLNRSTQGFTSVSFGLATDKFIPNIFVP